VKEQFIAPGPQKAKHSTHPPLPAHPPSAAAPSAPGGWRRCPSTPGDSSWGRPGVGVGGVGGFGFGLGLVGLGLGLIRSDEE